MVSFDFDIDWSRMAWIAFGFVLAAALLYVVYRFVGTFVFGLFIYYATRRLYRRLRSYVDQPSVAAGISLVGLALPAVLLVGYTLGIGLQQLDSVVEGLNGTGTGSQIDEVLEAIGPYLELTTLLEDPTGLLDNLGGVETITGTLGSVIGYLAVLGTGLLHLFVMFALAFYLLRDDTRFETWGRAVVADRPVFRTFVAEVDDSFDKVFYGNILNAIITGVVASIVFSLLNQIAPEAVEIPYAALLGLLAGGASLIPIVGMKLVYVPLGFYLAALAATSGEGWWFVGVFGVVTFVVVDVIPDIMVRPYVSGGKLHTGALMFAYILGPLIWGWYGIFLGPIILVLVSQFARVVLPELVGGEPIEPDTVDPELVTADDPPDDESEEGTPSGA